MPGKHFSEGIITRNRQSPPGYGEAGGLRMIKPAEDPVAKQSPRSEQGRVSPPRSS